MCTDLLLGWKLKFRGQWIWLAAMEELMSKGMQNASQVFCYIYFFIVSQLWYFQLFYVKMYFRLFFLDALPGF